jgi:multidrug efflux pump subunit AcrA (membrane-fusion protein)
MIAAIPPSLSSTDTPVPLRWWRRWYCKTAGAIVLALAAYALLASLFDGQRHLRIERDKLTISAVTRGTFHDFIPLRARLVPRDTIYLDAIEGGRVEQVLVEAGDMVEKDQPLVRLSNTELELVVLDREARLIESSRCRARSRSSRIGSTTEAACKYRIHVVRLERALNGARRCLPIPGNARRLAG